MAKISTPKQIKENNQGIFQVKGTNVAIDRYLQYNLDIKEWQDYVLVANQTMNFAGRIENVKMLHFVSQRGFYRFVQSGNSSSKFVIRKWLIPDLKKSDYSLWRNI